LPESSRHLVLVVDDDLVVLDGLCALLRARGFEVAGACSADEAIALLDRGLQPDAILTDLNMPGQSGGELADSVRGRHDGHCPSIVAMSACRRSLEALDSRADAKLLKPFDLEGLLQALAQVWAL